MKKILITILIVLFSSAVCAAEWLACDIPPAAEEVTQYAVIIDGGVENIVAYQENAANDAVLLWDVTSLGSASFSVFAINSQGRRSAVATPFDLLSKPSGPGGIRIEQQ